MDLKHLLAKVISILLILFGIYQIFLSLNAIFFIYPHLTDYQGYHLLWIEEGLIEKALLLYATMVVNGIYGVVLLFKPIQEVKIIHIFGGIAIFIVSVFFVVQTSFTTDPLQQFLLKLLRY